MDESIQRRVEELYRRCVLLPPAERPGYLSEQCPDPAVRREVEALLRNRATGGELTERFDLRTLESDQMLPRAGELEPVEVELSSQPLSPVTDLDSTTGDACDVLIIYAAADDLPTSAGPPDTRERNTETEGWISRFHRDLAARIERLSGEPVKIRRCPRGEEEAEVDEGVLANLPKTRALIAVLSPRFVRSAACVKQVEVFCDSASREGNLLLEGGPRVFKVVLRPLPSDEIPPRIAELFSSLLDFEFFDTESAAGPAREYDEPCEMSDRRYHERMYDLARDVWEALRSTRAGSHGGESSAATEGAVVYLATTTSDLEPERARLRRELTARGHSVLPDRPLPLVEAELVEAVEGFLERCELSVHTVGGMRGFVPEGADESVLELQNRIAEQHAEGRGLLRLIWIPGGIDIRDVRQQRWIDAIRTESARQKGTEIIEDRFDGVKTLLLRRLAEQAERTRSPTREKPPRVYLICDRRDEKAIESIEDFFFERGVEVSLPPFEASDEDAPRIHIENLRCCDAALVYYGAAGRRWVESHLRAVIKASGYRDSGPIPVQVVYVAPARDRGKERFESLSVEVLEQGDELESRVLDKLAVRILEARTDA